MTPSTSYTPDSLRKQIGPAIWLLILLVQHTPADWIGAEPAWVAGGTVICDSELATRLGISLAALAGWRRRLRNLDLLGWLISPRNGRAQWVARVARVFADSEATEQQPGPEANKPTKVPAATIWRVIEERSIALTGKVVEDLTAAEGVQLRGCRGGFEVRKRLGLIQGLCRSARPGSATTRQDTAGSGELSKTTLVGNEFRSFPLRQLRNLPATSNQVFWADHERVRA